MKWIINLLRRLNISKRIFLVVALCIIVFTTILLQIAQQIVTNKIESNYFSNTEWAQDEMAKGIELLISDINMLSIRVMNSKKLQTLIEDKELAASEKQSRYRSVLDGIIDWSIIGDVVVIDRDGTLLSAGANGFSGNPDMRSIRGMDEGNQLMWVDAVERDANGKHYVRIAREYFPYSSAKWLGHLFIYVPESTLYRSFENTSVPDGFSMVVSGNAVVLSCRDKTKVGTTLFDDSILEGSGFRYRYRPYQGQDSIFSTKDIVNLKETLGFDLKTVTIRSQSSMYDGIRQLRVIVLVVDIFVTLVALLFSYQISRRVVEPIHKLQDKLGAFGSGDELRPVYLKDSGDELYDLEKTYNEMIERITDLVHKITEEKIEQRKLQLIALQAQINPHFLYNTLDTITWIAKIKKQKEIEDLAMALAGFFRISLHKGEKYMRVCEEIDFVRNFVLIQQIRFPDKFEIDYDIQDGIEECRILKIMIQPFVENSIKHGIGPKTGKGHITVRGYKKDEDLVFEILDDGVGFDEKSDSQNNGESGGLNGYGVINVDERIKLEYGPDYGVTIQSTPGQGTHVTIRVRCELYPSSQ
ncbi:MAG TPA: hypothetical protein DEP23_10585 [Ruminococcaceae bacterium]|nr:hypothetical protein [Oscillospiraceae bacterium]